MYYIKEFNNYKFKSDIEELLTTHIRGRKFFNTLDDLIKYNSDFLLELVKGYENDYIASSGKFGDMLYELYESGKFKAKGLVIFNGKICTKKKGVTCWYPYDINLDNKEFIFIDDSIHSGRTIDKIESYLKREHNSNIKEISVAYDGKKIKDDRVKSIYRFYDEYPEKINIDD